MELGFPLVRNWRRRVAKRQGNHEQLPIRDPVPLNGW